MGGKKKNPTVGIALAGGALTGAAHPGYLKAILERFPRIDFIQGVSVGALQGAPLSQAKTGDEQRAIVAVMEKTWDNIKPKELFDFSYAERLGELVGHLRGKRYFQAIPQLRNLPLKEIDRAISPSSFGLLASKPLYDILSGYDPRLSVESPTEFEIIVMNLGSRKKSARFERFSSHDPRFKKDPTPLIPLIVSSASLSPLFEWVRVFGSRYQDGQCVQPDSLVEKCDIGFVLFPHAEEMSGLPDEMDEALDEHREKIPGWLLTYDFTSRMLARMRETDAFAVAREKAERSGKILEAAFTNPPQSLHALRSKDGAFKEARELAYTTMKRKLNSMSQKLAELGF